MKIISLLFPLMLFYLFHVLDLYKTRQGILPDASNEANPLGRFLHRNVPGGLHNNLVGLLYMLAVTLFVVVPRFETGLWIGYSFVLFHLGGFLSWTRLNLWRGRLRSWPRDAVFLIGLFVITAIGYGLAQIHLRFFGGSTFQVIL